MWEVYPNQFLQWFPNYSVMEDRPYSADVLAHLLYNLSENNKDHPDTLHVHNTFVSALLANGWIEHILKKVVEEEDDY